jgi:cbb3-type cytochrome oxidase maturation protein
MDILFLLVPLSVLLALAVMGVLAWAVWSGQFEELESEGQRIFSKTPSRGTKSPNKTPKTPDNARNRTSLIHINTPRYGHPQTHA